MSEIFEAGDDQWALVERWRALPLLRRQALWVTGASGSGKTAFLESARRRIPGSVLVDCTGLSADAVALRLLEACTGETEAADERRGSSRLRRDIRGPQVILLANTQFAGELVTSSEPWRVADSLAVRLGFTGRRDVRVMVERDSERMPPPHRGNLKIALPGSSGTKEIERLSSTGDEALDGTLGALSAAEVRRVPLPVWQLLCEAAGQPSGQLSQEALLDIARGHAEILVTETDEHDVTVVGFRSDPLIHAWRRTRPFAADAHGRVVDALLEATVGSHPTAEWARLGPTGRYAAMCLPLHSALAGTLPRLIEDGTVLANCRAASLWDALPKAYPDSIPQGSIAALVHYLEAQAVEPASQGEWVAWLHHAALSDGRAGLAESLAAAGVEMPWRTTWSRWRPSGYFGLREGEAGQVRSLDLRRADDGTVVLRTHGRRASWSRSWDAATGEPLAVGEQTPEWREEETLLAEHRDTGWVVPDGAGSAPPPRCPVTVKLGLRTRDGWLLAGDGGVFAIVGEHLSDPGPRRLWRSEPLIGPHTRTAPWPLPPEAAEAAEPVASAGAAPGREERIRRWLEATFGPGTCKTMAETEVPHGVSDPGARRFVTEVGFPDIENFLHLQANNIGASGLNELPWPSNARSGPGADGPFFGLGLWSYSVLLLDGSSGRVLRGATGGADDVLAGSSLWQFVTTVRLFDEYRRTPFPSKAARSDAKRNLREWCETIDPAAATGATWANILDDVDLDFEDDTWEFGLDVG